MTKPPILNTVEAFLTPKEIEERKTAKLERAIANTFTDAKLDLEMTRDGLRKGKSVWVFESEIAKLGSPIWLPEFSVWICHPDDRIKLGPVFTAHEVEELPRASRQVLRSFTHWLKKRTEALDRSLSRLPKDSEPEPVPQN